MPSYNAVSAIYLMTCFLLATFFIHHTMEFSKSLRDLDKSETVVIHDTVLDRPNHKTYKRYPQAVSKTHQLSSKIFNTTSDQPLQNHTKFVKKRKLQFPPGRSQSSQCKSGIPTPKHFKTLLSNRIGLDEIKNKTQKIYKSDEQTKILVMAQHRSGSSFFSELLNLHPEVFYLFEPLYQMEFREPEVVTSETYGPSTFALPASPSNPPSSQDFTGTAKSQIQTYQTPGANQAALASEVCTTSSKPHLFASVNVSVQLMKI